MWNLGKRLQCIRKYYEAQKGEGDDAIVDVNWCHFACKLRALEIFVIFDFWQTKIS